MLTFVEEIEIYYHLKYIIEIVGLSVKLFYILGNYSIVFLGDVFASTSLLCSFKK
jgi:hypothetical protein